MRVCLCLVVFSLCALGSLTPAGAEEPGKIEAGGLETWTGYKPIEEVSAPHKELAMASVLQILTVTLLEKNKDKYDVVDMSKAKSFSRTPRIRDDPRDFQIQTCRNQGIKKCPIFSTKESGSGFVNYGHEFYTCRHMIHNWITIAAKENMLSVDKISPPMELLDYHGKLVYSSAASDSNIMHISMINTDERLNFVLPDVQNLDNNVEKLFAFSEYVSLSSPVNFIKYDNIPISTAVTKGDTVFISGYPGKTTVFGGIKKGDTRGDQLVSSAGKIIDFSDQQQLISSSALGSSGISGGMVNNSEGEIVGIACNGIKGDKVEDDMASTTIMLNTDIIQRFWQFLLETPLSSFN